MTTLFSLIVVYLLRKYLINYLFFKNLQHSCNADWLTELLFKLQTLANNFPKVPIMAATGLLVLSFAIIILLIQMIFYYASASLGELILNIVLLFYCMASAEKKSYSSLFVAAFEHLFGLLFWFTILGPVGLGLFWLFNLGGKEEPEHRAYAHTCGAACEASMDLKAMDPMHADPLKEQSISNCLSILHTLAAWLPARITGLIFSLIGDFKQGFSCWKIVMRNLSTNYTEVLDLCGEAALSNATDDQPEFLVERALVAWLMICIMLGLII